MANEDEDAGHAASPLEATTEELERFWASVRRPNDDPDTCWEWETGDPDRSPFFRTAGGRQKSRVMSAHRWIWLVTHGENPKGTVLYRACLNKRCVRLSHIDYATRREVSQQLYDSGEVEAARGEASGRARLTNEDVIQIRRRVNSETLKSIADEFGVSIYTIWSIKVGRTWRHLADE